MIPRKKLDIGWRDLAYGAMRCLRPDSRADAVRDVEAIGFPANDPLACLSVRSGFHLLLSALELPSGSEVLMSAVNIRDMGRIVRSHGLVPVPLDVDMATLSVRPETLVRARSRRSRIVVLAHLFGSTMPLDGIIAAARAHGLLVVEDCAQAYAGEAYRGHPDSDVVMFSFGTIKTNTALGGALLRVQDPSLLRRMRRIEAGWKPASRSWYLGRVLKYALLKALIRPSGFAILYAASRRLGFDHERLINEAVRGFAGPRFFERIRRRPPSPLLRLLARRLETFEDRRTLARIAAARTALQALPGIDCPGSRSRNHTHWIVPVVVEDPDGLMRHLWRHGFDATRGNSSLTVLQNPRERSFPPLETDRWMSRVLYLPVLPGLDASVFDGLGTAVRAFVHPASPRRPSRIPSKPLHEPEPAG